MEVFNIQWKHSAVKELKKIGSKNRSRILQAVGRLSSVPYPDGCKKLKGSLHTYRIRIGDYRVIYEVESKTVVIVIVRVRHRKEVYK
jgi:mRNA interferase RelE/StbE